MVTSAKATIRLKLTSQRQLSTLFNALKPEANSQLTRRANVRLEKDGPSLVLTVEADDTVALRATLNAYLRWINSTLNIMDAVEHS